ncbi:hypothetical protein IAR50_001162 [Cryptococcus sp. DSM 104548]
MACPDSYHSVHSYHRTSSSNLSRRVPSHPKLQQLYPAAVQLPFSPDSSPDPSIASSPESSVTHIIIEPEFPPNEPPAKTTTFSPFSPPPPPPPPYPDLTDDNGVCRKTYSMDNQDVAEILQAINRQLQEVRFSQACLTDELRVSDQQARKLSDLELALGERIGQVRYLVEDHMEGNFVDSEHIYRRVQKSEKKLLAQLTDVRTAIEAIQEQQKEMLADDDDAELALWTALSSRSPTRPFYTPATPPGDDDTPKAFTVEDVLQMVNNVDNVVQCFMAQTPPSKDARTQQENEKGVKELREKMKRASLTWLNMTGLSLEDGTRGTPLASQRAPDSDPYNDPSDHATPSKRASQRSIRASASARKVSSRPSLCCTREVESCGEQQYISGKSGLSNNPAPDFTSSPSKRTSQASVIVAVPIARNVVSMSSARDDDSHVDGDPSVIKVFPYTSAPQTLTEPNAPVVPAFPRVPEPAPPGLKTPEQTAYPRLADMEYESMELNEYQQPTSFGHDIMPVVAAPTAPMTHSAPPMMQPQLAPTLRTSGLSKRKSAVLTANGNAETESPPQSPTKRSRVQQVAQDASVQSWSGREEVDVRNMLGASGGIDGAGMPPVAAASPARRRVKKFTSMLGLGGKSKQ